MTCPSGEIKISRRKSAPALRPLRAGSGSPVDGARGGADHEGVAGDSGVWLGKAGDAGEAMDDAAQELVAVQAGEVRSA